MIWGTKGGEAVKRGRGERGREGKGVGGGGHYYLKGVLIEARTMALCQQREGKREGNEEETIGMERRAVAIRPEKGGKQMVPPFDCIWECRDREREEKRKLQISSSCIDLSSVREMPQRWLARGMIFDDNGL